MAAGYGRGLWPPCLQRCGSVQYCSLMRIVVFGPFRRVGAWEGDSIVDVNLACAKQLAEQRNEIRPWL